MCIKIKKHNPNPKKFCTGLKILKINSDSNVAIQKSDKTPHNKVYRHALGYFSKAESPSSVKLKYLPSVKQMKNIKSHLIN